MPTFTMKLTQEQSDALDSMAAAASVSNSQYVRDCVFGTKPAELATTEKILDGVIANAPVVPVRSASEISASYDDLVTEAYTKHTDSKIQQPRVRFQGMVYGFHWSLKPADRDDDMYEAFVRLAESLFPTEGRAICEDAKEFAFREAAVKSARFKELFDKDFADSKLSKKEFAELAVAQGHDAKMVRDWLNS